MTTWSSTTWKPRLEKGMRISPDHPYSVVVPAASQNAFQSMLGMPVASLANAQSVRTPAGVVLKRSPFSSSL